MIFAFNDEFDFLINSCHFVFFLDIEFLKLRVETEDLVIARLKLGIELARVLTDVRNGLMSCQIAFQFFILEFLLQKWNIQMIYFSLDLDQPVLDGLKFLDEIPPFFFASR